MKTIKKNVYYCEFCSKRGLSAYHILKHEKHCTANPDRRCRLRGNNSLMEEIEKLKSRFEIIENELDFIDDIFTTNDHYTVEWKGEKITIDEILDITDGCPNCTLAILRQTRLNWHLFDIKYDYQKELSGWWKEKHKEELRHEYY